MAGIGNGMPAACRHVVLCAGMLAALTMGCTTGSPAVVAVPPPASGSTRIVLLGTGTPNAEPDRSGPAVAIVIGDRSYLVDAGAGVVRRATAAAAAGVHALRADNLDLAFITHLHSDHTVGLPDLILTPWVLGRERPLRLIGPPGLTAMAEHLSQAYREDVDARITGLEPANRSGFEVVVEEIEPGVVYRDDLVTVSAFAVPHGALSHAFGYSFATPDGIVVVSGDTGPSDAVASAARGAAVLLHEAYASAGWELREPQWQRYHEAVHTSGSLVGKHAAAAGVGSVILVHQLLWGAAEDDLVGEVAAAYGGPIFYGRDLDVYEVSGGRVRLQSGSQPPASERVP